MSAMSPHETTAIEQADAALHGKLAAIDRSQAVA